MMIRRMLALLTALVLLPCLALAQGSVVNLLDDPDAEYSFREGAELFTVVFPNIHGSDCCIMTYQDEVFMVDCSTDDQAPLLVLPVLKKLGITRVHTAFNSHPHDDHLTGFEYIADDVTLDRVVVGFPLDYNYIIKRTYNRLHNQRGVPFEITQNGEVFTMGDGGVRLEVIQRDGPEFSDNDQSAMLMITFGERSLFLTGDIGSRAQRSYVKDPPACGLHADIMKYPHHGHSRIYDPLWELMSPELVVVTAHEMPADDGFAFLKSKNTPGVSTWYGCIRLRTDGVIWVLDHYPEPDHHNH